MQIAHVISQSAALSALSCMCDVSSVMHCACLRLCWPCGGYDFAATPQAQRRWSHHRRGEPYEACGGINKPRMTESVSIVLFLALAGQGPADYPQRASKTSFERTNGP